MRNPCRHPFLCVIAALAALFTASLRAAEGVRDFDLPAAPAEQALKRFAIQSGLEVLFSTETTANVTTSAVHGSFTPREAIDRMLANTNLVAAQDARTGALRVSKRLDPKSRPTASAQPDQNTAASAPKAVSPAVGLGTVSGRVRDAATGRFLGNAKVTVVGSLREALTNTSGEFRFDDVPAGTVTLRVFFTGRKPALAEVGVSVGAVATTEVVLRDAFDQGEAKGEQTIVLDEFVVSNRRIENAAEIAINEQRVAANVKSVVSTDAFGDIAQNNVGEFLKYLPGVEVIYGDMNASGVQLRGMPAAQSGISIDGGGVSVPGGGASTRAVNFQAISLNNVARIEVSKSVLADTRADSLGGTINLVSRTAFERSRPEFSYKAFLNLNSHFAELRKTPWGHKGGDGERYKWFPDFEVNYVNPITPNLGIALNATRNDQFTLSRRLTKGWNRANTTADAPYLSSFTLLNYPSFEERTATGVKIDWRAAPRDVLSFALNTNYYFSTYEQHNLQFNTGNLNAALPGGIRNATTGDFSGTFTQGRPGAGSVVQSFSTNYGAQANTVARVTYRHTGSDWDFDAAGGGNKAKLWYRNESYGQIQSDRLTLNNVTVRFDDIGVYGPAKIDVRNSAGTAVDPLVLASYNQINPTFSQDRDARANARNAELNLKRKFTTDRFSGSLKAGAAYRSDARDVLIWRHSEWVNYVGPDGLANSGDEGISSLPPGTLLDPNFSTYVMTRGYPAPQWISAKKTYNLRFAHPEYFTYPVATQASDYTGTVDTTEELSEQITAGYVMGDALLFKGRLRLVGGVRREDWKFDGRGVLVDLTRQYQKDASGRLVDGDPNRAGTQFVPLTTDPLQIAKLTHLELGNHLEKTYHHYFPSFAGTFLPTENTVFRFGYARTIGRPDFGNLLPTLNINRVNNAADNAVGSALGTINAKNPNLKPWIADNIDLSLEYYTPKGGLFSVAVFRKNITDFFSSISSVATLEYLESVNLPEEYVNYLVITPGNVNGITHMTGIELSAQQKLTPTLSVFGNLSVNRNIGPADADFRGYVRQRVNAGFNYSRNRFATTVKFYYSGKVRGVANTAIAPDGWIYVLRRPRIDASVDYRLTKRVTAFLAGRNIFNDRDKQELAGSATPAYARLNVESEYGVLFQVGVRGAF